MAVTNRVLVFTLPFSNEIAGANDDFTTGKSVLTYLGVAEKCVVTAQ